MSDISTLETIVQAARDAMLAYAADVDNLTAGYRAKVADLSAQLSAAQATIADLRSPSGQALPSGDLPGWHQVLAEDFNTDCVPGALRAVYPQFGLYPSTYRDTSKRGIYNPANVDVVAGICRQYIWSSPTAGPQVSAIVPRLSSAAGWGDALGARVSVRMRADRLPGYKVAWLLWPQSNQSVIDGEIDWPEGNLDGTLMSGFSHRAPRQAAGDQYVAHSIVDASGWHTWTIEWLPGVSVTFILDGQVVGVDTVRVPAHPMHWVLQTETILDLSVPIDPKVAGHVEIDWVAAWTPVAL